VNGRCCLDTLLPKVCLVLACVLGPWQVASADDGKKSKSILAKSLCYLSKCSDSPYKHRLPSIGDQVDSGGSDQDIESTIKGKLGVPMWAVISGEYELGVSEQDTGMNYKAKWSQKSLKFEVKYRF